MSFIENFNRKIALVKAREQNKEFAKKFPDEPKEKYAPLLFTGARNNRTVVKEIKGTVTGKVIGYEDEHGTWLKACTDYHDRRTGNTIKSPETEEFEAVQALWYPYAPSS